MNNLHYCFFCFVIFIRFTIKTGIPIKIIATNKIATIIRIESATNCKSISKSLSLIFSPPLTRELYHFLTVFANIQFLEKNTYSIHPKIAVNIMLIR